MLVSPLHSTVPRYKVEMMMGNEKKSGRGRMKRKLREKLMSNATSRKKGRRTRIKPSMERQKLMMTGMRMQKLRPKWMARLRMM